MKSHRSLLLTSSLLALLAAPVHAAITYVDAVEGASGNTGITGQLLSDTSWVAPNDSSGLDTQWRKRTIGGTGSTIFQALTATNEADPSTIPQLTTTITGLTNGATYDVWVFFQDNVGDTSSPYQNWVLAAGLSPTVTVTHWSDDQPLAAHNSATPVVGTNGSGTISADAVYAGDLTFSGSPPVFQEGTGTGERRLYGVNLGPVTLSGETSIDVYIEQLIETNSSTTRTWYDGVGYELIPEPSTALLFGVALLGLLRRRRDR